MIQYIFIIGATGKVGSTLVRQILEKGDGDFRLHNNPTIIVGLASHNKYVFSKDGISKEECLNFIERKGKKGDLVEYNEIEDILVKAKKSGYGFERKLVFVDVTASKEIIDFHLKISKNKNFGLVTANKNPLALCDYDMFHRLTEDVKSYGYRCSVMAGAEAVSILQDLRDVNDPPTLISGCFSGTLGFICTELENGRKISEVIKEAKDKGYTEPHPRDDLNGLDVARKLLILARTAGYTLNMDQVEITPFIPKKYLDEENVGKFLNSTKGLDEEFSKKIANAKSNNNVMRYVAQMNIVNGNPHLSVSLKEIPKNSSLGNLKGTTNQITITSKVYPKGMPYIVEAPGAGLEVTAQNIRRDLLYQLDGRKSFK